MTSRTARTNEQLFSSRSADQTKMPLPPESPMSQLSNLHQQYGIAGSEEEDPLQLEHMLGYAGDFRKTVLSMPNNDDLYVKSLGSLLSIEDLTDPHSQRFFRGHDMQISTIAISASSRLIASGQVGTKNHKGNAAPVFLWMTETGKRITVLRGLTEAVLLLAFTEDEKFLCGCGGDGLLYIWDIATGDVVFGARQPHLVSVLMWTEQSKVGHHTAYELTLSMQNNLIQASFTYDPMRMQWSLVQRNYTLPPSKGLIRTFTSVAMSQDRLFVYAGTTSGEIMIYRRDSCVFRACIPVCSNGVQEIVVLPDESVVCGGGDGSFIRLIGRDLTWQKAVEVRLDSMIKSLTLSASMQEVLVSCSSGAMYRCNGDTLEHRLVSVSNTSAVTCMAFPPAQYPLIADDNVSIFATGTRAGEIRLWDLTDYACIAAMKVPKAGAALCLCMTDRDMILSGWQDGSIRASNSVGQQVWYIPTAHRDGTTTIAAHISPSLQYFATGGGDGAVRIWKYSNRELITQYTEHRNGVAKVLVDLKQPNIVHSVGGDCSVLAYDLKAARRIICHIVNSGVMLSMTQRMEREYEVVTADSTGRMLYWDIDIRDPVLSVQDPSRMAIRICQISPSGRYLAFAGDDQYLKVIDDATNQIVSIGQSHSGPILSLAWTPDERQVITGSEDTCLSVWNFYIGGAEHK